MICLLPESGKLTPFFKYRVGAAGRYVGCGRSREAVDGKSQAYFTGRGYQDGRAHGDSEFVVGE